MSRSRGILVSLALALGACAGSATAPKPSTAPTESSTTATTTRPTTPATTVPSTTTSPATTSTASPTTTLDAATITMAARAVLMIGIPFATLDEASRDHFSGGGRSVILFTGNIDDAASVTALTREVACAAGGPVLVAVDQVVLLTQP